MYSYIRVCLTFFPLPSVLHSFHSENIATLTCLLGLRILRILYVSFRIIRSRSIFLPLRFRTSCLARSLFQSPSCYLRHASPIINRCPLPAHLLRASSSSSVLTPRSPLASAPCARTYIHIARLSCDLAIRDTGVTMREPATRRSSYSRSSPSLPPCRRFPVACEESVSNALPAFYRIALRLPRIRFPAKLACSSE